LYEAAKKIISSYKNKNYISTLYKNKLIRKIEKKRLKIIANIKVYT